MKKNFKFLLVLICFLIIFFVDIGLWLYYCEKLSATQCRQSWFCTVKSKSSSSVLEISPGHFIDISQPVVGSNCKPLFLK
jgi:hypothetical protein